MRTLLTLGLGAAAMYLLDPEQGPRRRAQLRERWMDGTRRLRERASGTAAEARGPMGVPLEQDKPADTPPGAHHLGR
jgi:hypothetical protein